MLGPRVMAAIAVVGGALVGFAATKGAFPAVLAALAMAGALVIQRRPHRGGLLLAAAVPITSGLARGIPVPGLRISEVLVVGAASLVLASSRRVAERWTAVDGWLLAYALGTVLLPFLHLLARPGPVAWGSMPSMLLPLQFFLLYRTVVVSLRTPEHQRTGLRLLLGSSLLVAVVAALQQLDVGSSRQLVARITDSEALRGASYAAFARATGPFQHWHPLAGYLTVVTLLAAASLLVGSSKSGPRDPRRLAWVALAGSTLALALSVTFVAVLGVIAGIVMMARRTGRLAQAWRWVLIGGAVTLLLFGPLFVERVHNQYRNADGSERSSWVPQTIQKRLDAWDQEYVPGMVGHWLLGYGPDLPTGVEWTHTESEYLTVLLRGGVVLLVLYCGTMAAVWSAVRHRPAGRQPQGLAPAGLAIQVLVPISLGMALLYPYMTSSGMPQAFWVLAAIAIAPAAVGDVRNNGAHVGASVVGHG